MKRAFTLLFLAGLLAGVLGAPAQSADDVKTKEYGTKLSIQYGVGMLQGTIESKKGQCFDGRKVDVFTNGRFVGRPTTNEYGVWSLEAEQGSRYTAKIDEFLFKQTKETKYVCEDAVVRIP